MHGGLLTGPSHVRHEYFRTFFIRPHFEIGAGRWNLTTVTEVQARRNDTIRFLQIVPG